MIPSWLRTTLTVAVVLVLAFIAGALWKHHRDAVDGGVAGVKADSALARHAQADSIQREDSLQRAAQALANYQAALRVDAANAAVVKARHAADRSRATADSLAALVGHATSLADTAEAYRVAYAARTQEAIDLRLAVDTLQAQRDSLRLLFVREQGLRASAEGSLAQARADARDQAEALAFLRAHPPARRRCGLGPAVGYGGTLHRRAEPAEGKPPGLRDWTVRGGPTGLVGVTCSL